MDKMLKHIVCYLDILGYSKIVQSYEQNPEILENFKQGFQNIVNYFPKKHVDDIQKSIYESIRLTILSDSIILELSLESQKLRSDISVEYSNLTKLYNLFMTIRAINIIIFINTGHFCRGAIVEGLHFNEKLNNTSDNRFIFSQALIKALQLEKKSEYPRIIIDNSVFSLTKQWYDSIEGESKKHPLSVVGSPMNYMPFIDHTGIRCLDIFFDLQYRMEYLGKGEILLQWLSIMKQKIEKQMEANRANPDIIKKYVYLATYFNHKIKKCALNSDYLISLNNTVQVDLKA